MGWCAVGGGDEWYGIVVYGVFEFVMAGDIVAGSSGTSMGVGVRALVGSLLFRVLLDEGGVHDGQGSVRFNWTVERM